jgi:hypothetical protein
MRIIVIGAVIVAALLGGFFLFNNYIYQEKQGEASVERETVSGVVTAVDLEPLTYDGPARVTVRTDSGEERVIEVPARINLCEAMSDIADVSLIAVGDRVEATGDVYPETGTITPCGSVEHYLRAVATFTDPALDIEFSFRRGPDGYIFFSAPHGNEEEENFEEMYVLMLKSDYDMLQNLKETEGPPAIAVAVYRNPKNQEASAWALANPDVSNTGLAVGEPVTTVVGGAQAVRYTVDGLYRIDTVVIAHGEHIYVVSGAYQDENSTIRKDFAPFLESVTFVEKASEKVGTD